MQSSKIDGTSGPSDGAIVGATCWHSDSVEHAVGVAIAGARGRAAGAPGRGRAAALADRAAAADRARRASRSASARCSHWFDGLAMLHRFAFADGARLLLEPLPAQQGVRARRARRGEIGYSEFATDPCRSIFGRAQAAVLADSSPTTAPSTSSRLGDETLALTETPLPVAFEPETLETLGVTGWAKAIPGQVTIAHPHYDFERASSLSYAAHLGPRSRYRIYAREARRRAARDRDVPVDRPAYMHSFALTERYAVLAEWPLTVNPMKLALSGRPFIENYRWEPERGTRYTVIDRRDGSAARAGAGAGVRSPSTTSTRSSATASWSSTCRPTTTRASSTCSTSTGSARARRCPTCDAHAPPRPARRRRRRRSSRSPSRTSSSARIDYRRRNARDYRYAWGASARDGRWLDSIVKARRRAARRAALVVEDGCYPGEPVFVARPGARRGRRASCSRSCSTRGARRRSCSSSTRTRSTRSRARRSRTRSRSTSTATT